MIKVGDIIFQKAIPPYLLVVVGLPTKKVIDGDSLYICEHNGTFFKDYFSHRGQPHCGHIREKNIILTGLDGVTNGN